MFATTHKDTVNVGAYRIRLGRQHSLFNFFLPTHAEFRSKKTEIENMFGLHATDWRSGKAISYYPAREPQNASVQQGFARVVQDGVREILSVVPRP